MSKEIELKGKLIASSSGLIAIGANTAITISIQASKGIEFERVIDQRLSSPIAARMIAIISMPGVQYVATI
ncbi:MAG TPA: hypothetical protein PKC98_01450 [Candidatus Melainabacteria bacterium]|nr:hypothetical protein [Candidatus Melainabacteria bacterium]